jgi:hypothetical protein
LCLCGGKINKMSENEISKKIIGAAIEVHKQLGPGLLESGYSYSPTFNLFKTKRFKTRIAYKFQ